jgi:hypothetical protein
MKISKNLFVRIKNLSNVNNKLRDIGVEFNVNKWGSPRYNQLFGEQDTLYKRSTELEALIDKDFSIVMEMFKSNPDVGFNIDDIVYMLESKQSSAGKLIIENEHYLIYAAIKEHFDEKLTVISLDTSHNKEDNFYGYVFNSKEYFTKLMAKSSEVAKKFSDLC